MLEDLGLGETSRSRTTEAEHGSSRSSFVSRIRSQVTLATHPEQQTACTDSEEELLRPGVSVVVQGLRKQHAALNGAVGRCMGFDADRGRWKVLLASDQEIFIRPKRLHILTSSQQPSVTASGSSISACKDTLDGALVALICFGNPGSGKSTLLNSMIGQPHFRSGFSAGRGLTEKMEKYEDVHQRVMYIDTPGLADPQMRKSAAAAITEALQQDMEYRLLFVVTLEGFCCRPQDVATLKLVLESLEDAGVAASDYGMVVNKVLPSQERVLPVEFFNDMLATEHVMWLEVVNIEDKESEILSLPDGFQSFLARIPRKLIRKESVRPVKWDRFEDIVNEIQKLSEQNKKHQASIAQAERALQKQHSRENAEEMKLVKADVQISRAQKRLQFECEDRISVLRDFTNDTGILVQIGWEGTVVGAAPDSVTIEFADPQTRVAVHRRNFHNLCVCTDVDDLKRNTALELTRRGLTVEAILDFYEMLSSSLMENFIPEKSTTRDVVFEAIIPKTRATGLSYAQCVNGGPLFASRMVSHNWGNLFSHLVAAIVADAMDMPSFAEVHRDLTEIGGIARKKVALQKSGKNGVVYWVCAFSVNQHVSICKPECTCSRAIFPNSSPECEMDKFDDMMHFLFNPVYQAGAVTHTTVPRHVIAVDVEGQVFSRAWVVAELVVAQCMDFKLEQKYSVYDEMSLRKIKLSTGANSQGISIWNCKASRPEDEELVKCRAACLIEKNGGDEVFHERLNQRIFDMLEETRAAVQKQQAPHVLCIGNAGVGKSTILNLMIGEDLFPQTDVSTHSSERILLQEAEHCGAVYMEAVGLADPSYMEMAAREISAALQRGGCYQLFFVIVLESGRVRPEDVAMIEAVLSSAPIGPNYSIIFNKVSRRATLFLANPGVRQAIAKQLFSKFAEKNLDASTFVSWVERASPAELPPWLLRDAPKVCLVRSMTRAVLVETALQTRERLAAEKEKLEANNAALKRRLAALQEVKLEARGSALQRWMVALREAGAEEREAPTAQSSGVPDPSIAFWRLDELVGAVQRDVVRLVDGHFLVEWFESGRGAIQRRQDMPAEAFLDRGSLEPSKLHVIALSYCWCSRSHPDPEGFHLSTLVKILKLLLGGDPDDIKKFHVSVQQAGFLTGLTADMRVGIFWDYMSLPQQPRSAVDDGLFKEGLKYMNPLYGNNEVTTFIFPGLPKGSLQVRTSYDESGWPRFEQEIGNIISPPGRMLRWENHCQSKENYLMACFAARDACERTGPMEPAELEKLLDRLRFTNGADRELVVYPMYRAAFEVLVQHASKISWSGFKMSKDKLDSALEVVGKHCPQLRVLDLTGNEVTDSEAVRALLCGRLFSQLQTLRLVGCLELRVDVASFAGLQQLQRLDLRDCSGLFGDVAGLARLERLQYLDMQSCAFLTGDVAWLADLVQLQTLCLAGCTGLSGDVAFLVPLVQLQTLVMTECSGLNGNVASLESLTQLRAFGGCPGLSGELASLGLLAELQILDLHGCALLSGNVHCLTDLVQLQALDLSGCSCLIGGPSDVLSFTQLQQLRELDVCGCSGVRGDFPAVRAALPRLRLRYDA